MESTAMGCHLTETEGRVNDSSTISGHIKWKMLSLIQLVIKCNEMTTNKEKKRIVRTLSTLLTRKILSRLFLVLTSLLKCLKAML